MIEAPKNWLVWSNEHTGWWAPGQRGYVGKREHAGRYTFAEALAIVKGADRDPAALDIPNEVMMRDDTVLTIPETTVRQEGWNAAKQGLRTTLDAIPFTSTQRRNIDEYVEMLEQEFDSANV